MTRVRGDGWWGLGARGRGEVRDERRPGMEAGSGPSAAHAKPAAAQHTGRWRCAAAAPRGGAHLHAAGRVKLAELLLQQVLQQRAHQWPVVPGRVGGAGGRLEGGLGGACECMDAAGRRRRRRCGRARTASCDRHAPPEVAGSCACACRRLPPGVSYGRGLGGCPAGAPAKRAAGRVPRVPQRLGARGRSPDDACERHLRDHAPQRRRHLSLVGWQAAEGGAARCARARGWCGRAACRHCKDGRRTPAMVLHTVPPGCALDQLRRIHPFPCSTRGAPPT